MFFFLLLRPRRVFLDNNKKCLGYYIGSKKTRQGHSKKKTPLPGCFFFAPAPGGRSLTHCGPGWRCLPLAGVVFVFFAAGRGRTGVVFFFCCGPARTLTHSLWAGAISARPGWCFFFLLLRPRRVFLDNNKKCLGYYIGSKKTRQGHSKKKTPLPGCFFLLRPRADAHSLTAGLGGDASPSPGWCLFFLLRGGAGPGWCFFFLLWPRPDAHSLTVGWGDFGKARVVFFFCCGPTGSF